MERFYRETHRKTTTQLPETPLSEPSRNNLCSSIRQFSGFGEIVGEGANRVEYMSLQPTSLSAVLMPACRKPGRQNLTLSVPTIPSTPSNAPQYGFTIHDSRDRWFGRE